MKTLILSTSSNNVFAFIGSLQCLGTHEVTVLHYDQKWHQIAQRRLQNPQALQHYQQTGQIQPPISLDECSMEDEIMAEVKQNKPDVIVYISAWTGAFVPLNEVFQELNAICPVIHFLCDGADEPWWPKLKEFERRKQFSLTVNIDGGHYWPGGDDWLCGNSSFNLYKVPDWHIDNALTLLTPLDTRVFAKPMLRAFEERPYAITFAGNGGTPDRDSIIKRLATVTGFEHRPRDHNPQSYPQFVEHLRNSRIVVSVPFTGTGQHRHVKGRVLEAGFTGGCLLEWKNDATAAWFEPRRDYWEYSSVEECAEYAAWLATHPRVASEIAQSLAQRVFNEHRPEIFWEKVFAAVGK